MYVVNGIGEPTLKGANLSQERDAKGEFVTRIAGGTNGAKRSNVNVKCGKMIKGELCLFSGNLGKGNALADATML